MICELGIKSEPTGGFVIAELPGIESFAFSYRATAEEVQQAIWDQRRKRVAVLGGPLPSVAVYCIVEAG